MKTIKALSDRFLKLFLSEVPTGACVPEAGKCCSGRNMRFDCYGACKYSLTC